ncbi:hypothetical protein [Candidatus Uabimicrobium sp. HlEnr_7]|uniref:hypothetical protein n=1 Tax=Candidatus Uabimicrobium helgolandensis TaxID=3095367 RepID=UPI00355633FB
MFGFFVANNEQVTHTFKFNTEIPEWGIATIVAVMLLWIYICYKREVGCQSLLARGFLGLLRLSVLLLLLVILCEPVWEEKREEVKKSNLLFLLDSSVSMNTKDRYPSEEEQQKIVTAISQVGSSKEISKATRIEIVQDIVNGSKRLKELKEECNVHFFKFDTALSKLSLPPDWKTIDAEGKKTDIYGHIAKAIDSMQGRTITAVFVFTDGQHNTGHKSWQEIAEFAYKKEVPVFTIGIGSTLKKKDIVLTAVEAPEIALKDDNVPFEVEVKHVGYEGETIPIYLKWGEIVLEEKSITLGPEETRQRITIPHTFQSPGDYNITVQILEQSYEANVDNNLRQHNIRIIEEKLRVLYLEGPPRWEYRYLRNALIRDRTITANTYLFSADSRFPHDKSADAPSISGFPSEEEIADYHCIIIGDVSPDDLNLDRQKLLIDYVKDQGGGLVFISGERHNPTEYWGSDLAPLLPIVVNSTNELSPPFSTPYGISLTAEGKTHSIMRLLSDSENNVQLWENQRMGLPPYYWYYPVDKVKPGATVLAVNRETRSKLFTTQYYGRGKTFFAAIDSSWRWRYIHGDRYFYRFWGQVIRHISKGILLSKGRQYYLRVDNSQYVVGDMVNITLKIVDNQKREEIDEDEWLVYYSAPGSGRKEKKLKKNPSESGAFQGSLVVSEVGNYKIWFKTPEDKEISVLFNVEAPLAESGKSELNDTDLKKLSEKTNGKHLKIYDLEKHLRSLEPIKETIPIQVRSQSILDKNDWVMWLLMLLLSLYTLEWMLRKVFRLL